MVLISYFGSFAPRISEAGSITEVMIFAFREECSAHSFPKEEMEVVVVPLMVV